MTTLGTHNLHDREGLPTFFADAIGFTEGIPGTIKARNRARWARAKGRLAGYTVRVCTHQKDLSMALRRSHWKVTATKYYPCHGGRAEVTPHRGTFVVESLNRKRWMEPEAFVLPHRINAAFYPFIRGEAEFRADMWSKHAELDNQIIEDYLARGWTVHAFGDVNTPRTVDGFPTLPFEVGHGFDRIASSRRLSGAEYLSRKGSDHPRLRVVVGR